MKAMSSSTSKALSTKSLVKCADNSGVKIFEIITAKGYKTKRKGRVNACVGSMVWCRTYKGNENVRNKVFRAVIVRQKKEYRRADGMRISFEDNAAVMVDEKGEPKASMIKGPVAKEAVERFPGIGKIARIIV
ncbi:MAG: 50S ribosomal protein L14 [Candidatus Aenigmatarchaeota archaeon]|nr:MAG: 50S ribosomal protein L14 [Candidatus Aenigmarchaeota archaeon]